MELCLFDWAISKVIRIHDVSHLQCKKTTEESTCGVIAARAPSSRFIIEVKKLLPNGPIVPVKLAA